MTNLELATVHVGQYKYQLEGLRLDNKLSSELYTSTYKFIWGHMMMQILKNSVC